MSETLTLSKLSTGVYGIHSAAHCAKMADASSTDAIDFSTPCILGIDEAGRGPVLGPMVYAAAYCPKTHIKALNALGADDSKQLTAEQREGLLEKISGAPFCEQW